MMQLDFEQAKRYLRALDPSTDRFTFLTLDDNRSRKHPALTRVLRGTLSAAWSAIETANRRGAGVFVGVNGDDGNSRRGQNIVSVRAVWHEDDTGLGVHDPDTFLPVDVLLPSMVVETSPGRHHRYWLVDGATADWHRTIMDRFVALGSDKSARDISRILRLPGTYHVKNVATPHLVRIVDCAVDAWGRYSVDDINEGVPVITPRKPEPPGANGDLEKLADLTTARELGGFTAGERAGMLAHVPGATRADWLLVGQALHHASGGSDDGYAEWDAWSRAADVDSKYDAADQSRVWQSFSSEKTPAVTLASVASIARKNGWTTSGSVAGLTPLANVTSGVYPFGIVPRELDIGALIARRRADIMAGYLGPGQFGQIVGNSSAGKSFVALDLAWSLAVGKPWHGAGKPIRTQRTPVIYVTLEGQEGFQFRTLAKLRDSGDDPGDWFVQYVLPVALTRSAGDEGVLALTRAMQAVRNRTGHNGPVVLVIDTYARAMAGDDENSTADAALFVQNRAGALQREGATVLLVHHLSKQGSVRGSVVLPAAADLVLMVKREGNSRCVIAEKVKDGADGLLFNFKLRGVTLAPASGDDDAISSAVVDVVSAQPAADVDGLTAVDGLPDPDVLTLVVQELIAIGKSTTVNTLARKLQTQLGVRREQAYDAILSAIGGRQLVDVDGSTIVVDGNKLFLRA